MRSSVLVMSALLALVATLAACKNETVGLPGGETTTAAGTPSGGPFTGSNTTRVPTSNSVSPGPLATVSPCSLLTDAEAASLGVGAGKQDDSSISRDCEYVKSGSYALGVTIYDKLGIKDVTARGELKKIVIGKHDAVQGVSAGAICAITFGVTESSRVDATVSAHGDEKVACDVALSLAKLVEPKLP